jgi:putative effector of murein hydrolase LrgA (UPF0299 family)
MAAWWAFLIPPFISAILTLIISAIIFEIWKKRDEKKKADERMKKMIKSR